MHFKTLITTALAATVAAERVPYKLSRKSVNLIALAARSDAGYQPEQTFCGAGDTCAEACGTGFDQCASTDGLSHCYDTTAGESCCKDDNGRSSLVLDETSRKNMTLTNSLPQKPDACESGYYCAVDTTESTWCCPDGMSPEECAAEYSVTGGLSSQVPEETATSVSDAEVTGTWTEPCTTDSSYTAPYPTGTGSGSWGGEHGGNYTTGTETTGTYSPGSPTASDEPPVVSTAAGNGLVASGAVAAVVALVASFL
ncbi:hypothetical protein MKZ38_003190 [Zalerion maritima]|uniref:Uncharacterized protein n=1 Tax=Zalerion maritima TaxID=339359 RepID=A0AAD5WXQ2_9PEZI|nr:hypothetical protein MKZ38_003190 [Zalerion maritima]